MSKVEISIYLTKEIDETMPTVPPVGGSAILMEDGTDMLMEDGTPILME